MTSEEQLILDIIGKVFSGQFSRKTAQQVLNVSERTLERYLKGYREKGPLFVKHGNCNKKPTNKIDEGALLIITTRMSGLRPHGLLIKKIWSEKFPRKVLAGG